MRETCDRYGKRQQAAGGGKRSLRGSMTVFLALTLGLMLSVVFGFLEAARVGGLRGNAQMQTLQAADSLLSEYDPKLWKDYGLLFREAPDGQTEEAAFRQKQFLDQNEEDLVGTGLTANFFFLDVSLQRAVVDAFELASDDGGLPFRRQAVKAAQAAAPEETIQALKKLLSSSEDPDYTQEAILSMEDAAQKTMRQMEEGAKGEETGDDKTKDEDQKGEVRAGGAGSEKEVDRSLKKDNPIQWMLRTKKQGILALVYPDHEISERKLDTTDLLSKRRTKEGNYPAHEKEGKMDRAWFQWYLSQHFCDAVREKADGPLRYQMEYLLAGKAEDAKNLKAAANRLLLLREGSNYACLAGDGKRSREAMAMAAAIAAAFGQPELEPAIRQGVLLAWAYAESISDVRILMGGGKLTLIKSPDQWKTDLSHLAGSFRGEGGNQKGDTSGKGLNYTQFLQLLLLTQKEETVSYRAMDLIEQGESVRMDHMVSRMDCSYLFEATPLFWRFVSIGNHAPGTYSWQLSEKLAYWHE